MQSTYERAADSTDRKDRLSYDCKCLWVNGTSKGSVDMSQAILKQNKETILTHIRLESLLWDIGKQDSPRCDAAERGVPSGSILFAQ